MENALRALEADEDREVVLNFSRENHLIVHAVKADRGSSGIYNRNWSLNCKGLIRKMAFSGLINPSTHLTRTVCA